VNLELFDRFRRQSYPIATNIANSGTFTYSVPSDQKTSGPYYVKVVNSSDQSLFTWSQPLYVEDWDWMQDKQFDIFVQRTQAPGGIAPYTVHLPYYSDEGPVASDIKPSEMHPAHGWTLLYAEFGNATGGVTFPRMIFYNRYTAVLRLYYFYANVDDTWTQGVVKLRRHMGHLPSLFAFMDEGSSEFLDSYEQTRELTYIGELELGVWNYADFVVAAYDPNPSPNSTLEFQVFGLNLSNVNLFGTIDLSQVNLASANAGSMTAGQTITIAGEAAVKAWTAYKSVNDFADEVDKKTRPGGSWADKPFAPTLRTLFVTGAMATGHPYIAAAAVAISYIAGAVFKEKESVTPVALKGGVHLEGTISNMNPMPEFFMRIPGVRYTDPSITFPSPKYDELLGIYNLRTMPVIWYANPLYSQMCPNLPGVQPLYISRDVRPRFYHKPSNVNSSLFAVNPLLNVVVKVATVAPNALPDFYVDQTADGYETIIGRRGASGALKRRIRQEVVDSSDTGMSALKKLCNCSTFDNPLTPENESDPLRCLIQRDLAVHVQVVVPEGDDAHFFKTYKTKYELNASASR